MKVAIHHRLGSFSDRWIKYMDENEIPYILLNAFDNDIIKQVKEENVSHFMWHFSQNNSEDLLHAKVLLRAFNSLGMSIFPNENSFWHFDDKVAQKYLLEALGAPLVNTDVFYEKALAKKYIQTATFPKVFKLRGGAGSINVKLIKSKSEATRIISKAFGKGFKTFDNWNIFKDTISRFRRNRSFINLLRIIKWGWLCVFIDKKNKNFTNQKGYVYFQEFIPNLKYDIRLITVNKKCFFLKRYTRDNDFRASGSGRLDFTPSDDFDVRAVKIAFDIHDKLSMDCTAFDFVFAHDDEPKIVEISYGFQPYAYDKCEGYFNENYQWIESKQILEYEIIKGFLNSGIR